MTQNPIQLKRTSFILSLWIILTGAIIQISTGSASAEWRAPISSDYQKDPVFASYAAKPNIMIVLDNSGSMDTLAYSDGYTGTPYNGTIMPVPVDLERDDMEENSAGGLRDGGGSGNDLDFGTDFIATRFQNVSIPQGATITSARIEFVSKNNWTGVTTDLEIKGEASDDAAFLDVAVTNNISARATTAATVAWTPGDWVSGQHYDTPDLKDIVQEIVNQAGWAEDHAMLFRIAPPDFPTTASGHREAYSREAGANLAPVLHVTFIDQVGGTRYYGYFNPDYFYKHSSNVFWPTYKKVSYDPFANSWKVKTLAGAATTITDGDIAPAVKANGLWDGNWMNWLCMRRVDVLRKVLMGGKATSRTGGGNQQNQAESKASNANKYFNSTDGPATSPYKGGYTYTVQGDGDVYVSNASYKIDIQKDINIEPEAFFEGNLAGILQRIGDRARWGNMWFNYNGTGKGQSGGYVENPIGNGFGTNFLPSLQNKDCNTWTPLAETMYVATQYFAQENVASGLDYPVQSQLFKIAKNTASDPYYDWDEKISVPCAKSFVLLLTDGASTKDAKIPTSLKDFDNDGKDDTSCDEYDGNPACNYPSGGTDFLDDVALYARTTDLRTDLDGPQNLMLYTVFAFDDDHNARSLLQDAARNGGFNDLDGDNRPSSQAEWDKDGDNIPDTYFEASDGYTLEKQMLAAINDILKRASSGTAASVVSNSRSGEGAVYQSIFFPATTAGANTVKWVGQIHSLLSDAYGNIREDSNGNKKLDLVADRILVFGDTTLQKYEDTDGNGLFEPKDMGLGPDEGPLAEDGTIDFLLSDVHYLWSSHDWLDELTDPVTQRAYTSTAKQRYIFTFVDADGDMVADSGEVKDFAAISDPTWSQAIDPTNYYAYIHTFDTPFVDPPPVDPAHADFKSMICRQIRRTINFTRGEDQGYEEVGALALPAYRNRQIDYDDDGTIETWRLGDIVYSTPTVISAPSEDFDMLYRDKGYTDFYRRYQNRRNVVYVGSNDGMVHAFNSGFFSKYDNGFKTHPVDAEGDKINDGHTYHEFEIGEELWAYVPFNQLAHLHWLTYPDYEHIYYNDLQPRIFDARVYPDKGANDATNPNGWATLMVVGMRFGGGKIAADIDKSDGTYDAAKDKSMSSAYVILDITDPEQPPKLLGEVTFPELGFTTCRPGVVPMRDFDEDHEEQTNQWYLLIGSGPASADGSSVSGPNTTALLDGTSNQKAVMYAIDLVELAQNKKLITLTNSGSKEYTAAAAADPYYLIQFNEAESFISDPVVADWNFDFNADAAYFGLTYGSHVGGWNGKLRRIVMENGADPTSHTNWTLDSTLLNLTDGVSKNLANGQPVVATANAGFDKVKDRWIYFGTGRFYATEDKLNTDQQSFYGVKETFKLVAGEKTYDYKEVDFDDLMDVTDIKVYENGNTLSGFSGSFNDLTNDIEDNYLGWRLNFDLNTGERNLGQSVLAGEVLTFTTYVPSADPCAIGGESFVYALYYRTGTAYTQSISAWTQM
ncbi:MAG: hypothetical protein HKP58_19075, partial [Desulfatitalea sp.]|nr:hypothetical protein [Desulfatitalea sp.]NNK02519.1 hypothetical protein [Desulfatitalea sp.]